MDGRKLNASFLNGLFKDTQLISVPGFGGRLLNPIISDNLQQIRRIP